jgi:hypothetical protein
MGGFERQKETEEGPMRKSALAMAALMFLLGGGPASTQGTQNWACLHGSNETPANRTRREKAVELAHAINDAQNYARGLRRPSDTRYFTLDQLEKLPETPSGFRVQLVTDDSSYSFSVKDMMDPCLYAVFSDQSGDVYEAVPSPSKARVRLLSRK